MPTLHMDLKLGLSTDKTRTLLGEYSRGCDIEELIYSPKIEFIPNEEYFYALDTKGVFIFLSDFFGRDHTFELTLIKTDNTVTVLPNCNILVVDCNDLQSVKVVNKSKEVKRAHIIR